MPKTSIPQMTKATALKPYIARITWDNGTTADVDLSEWLHKSGWFKPVLESDEVWKTLTLGEWGWDIEWTGCEMEVPSTTLWRLQLEQNRKAMKRTDFEHWMKKYGLTLEQTADLLGISRRMAAYYKSGEKVIPRTILLACMGAEQEMHEQRDAR